MLHSYIYIVYCLSVIWLRGGVVVLGNLKKKLEKKKNIYIYIYIYIQILYIYIHTAIQTYSSIF